MCLAYPGRVVALSQKGKRALVDYGNEKREADNTMAKAKIGDWVLVQYKMVVAKLSEKEAQEILRLHKRAF
ncbi:MAG: HypC/HybG/HupF family hydrogenase formation chaperone [Candidatus Diapherotrites archaeon]|nr:HypC/HybG/HupF family hydrogenase formation chaperone [Candidatus Diapherotrites archaeon]